LTVPAGISAPRHSAPIGDYLRPRRGLWTMYLPVCDLANFPPTAPTITRQSQHEYRSDGVHKRARRLPSGGLPAGILPRRRRANAAIRSRSPNDWHWRSILSAITSRPRKRAHMLVCSRWHVNICQFGIHAPMFSDRIACRMAGAQIGLLR